MDYMETIREFTDDIIANRSHKIILSGKRNPNAPYRKVTFTLLDDEYFVEKLTDKQAFHSRVKLSDASDELERIFSDFTQINAWSEALKGQRMQNVESTARITKKGKLLTGSHSAKTIPEKSTDQNRQKSYLLAENRIVPPLVDMGVMTSNGEVRKSMYDKFRQINRFLEFIDDAVKNVKEDSLDSFTIIDFGCGKSYLTFIVYYYFTEIKHMPIKMRGIDLKADVIDFCSKLAEKYGYADLSFTIGDIADFDSNERVDMVISLHACDTATDYALFHAVKRNARFILSVPCCQHELAKSADFGAAGESILSLFDDDGILRERVSSLMTDAIRTKLLTACGYKAQLLEFVDLCHTPKNLLIRAKKTNISDEARKKALKAAQAALGLIGSEQKLHQLLIEEGIVCKR